MNTETLDELVAGRLPDRINTAIDEMEISLEEMAIWQASKPGWYVATKAGALVVQLNIRVPLKVAIGAVGSVSYTHLTLPTSDLV